MNSDDVIVTVQGEDWDGNPTQRAGRPGAFLALRGKYGEGFDVRGPHCVICVECHEPLHFPTGGHARSGYQRHLAFEHSLDAPMMR